MATQDERDLKDVTAALSQDGATGEDPDETRVADQNAEQAEDPDATRVVTADGDATVVMPSASPDAAEADPVPDGIDTMDDPYYAPVSPEDLTMAHAPVTIASPVQSLPERKRRLPRWAKALLAVALVAVAALAAWYTYDQELWGGKTVPAVVGLTQEEAVEELEELGFEVSIKFVLADDNIGIVLASSPSEGERVDPADGITLSVAVQRTIPEVVGLDVTEAQEALVEAGAQNILLTYQNSDEAAGTVLSVTPGEGEVFTSEDQVTLVVARAYAVPDVLGMTLDEAEAELTASGLVADVTYVSSDAEKNTVVSTDPGVGERVDSGATVTLSVASPLPSDPYDLLAYFDAIPQALAQYLEEEGFTLSYGGTYASGGNARVAYVGEYGDLLQVMNDPENGRYSGDSEADVLAWGSEVGGVRYAFSVETLPDGADVESVSGVRAVMAACGFEGLLDTCTQDDIVMPDDDEEDDAEDETDEEDEETDDEDESDTATSVTVDESEHHFICGYGTQGDYTWAVIIGGYGDDTHVVALVAPTSHFSAIDLTSFGNSVCDYIAYVDQYQYAE